MRIALGGLGLVVFAVAAVLTPFAMFADWPVPLLVVLIDSLALFVWAQSGQLRSGLSWARTFEWLGIFVGLLLAMVAWFLFVRIVAGVVGQSVLAVVGYVVFVVALLWAFGWVMGDTARARAFLALRRVMSGRASSDDVAFLDRGPRAYR